LGTAGSLRYLDGKFDNPFFVTNCDIIIKADYNSLYEFHQKGGYDISLVASAKEYIIPYGTCELNEDGHLSHINEKPHFDFLINTGLYILDPDVLKLIPKNEFYHMTQLIQAVKDQGKKVGVFPVDNATWIDIGQWAEYKQVMEKF
jgi:NDP-sugar pyrophosphorylase family protein